jgi:RHS repeat-associated protein
VDYQSAAGGKVKSIVSAATYYPFGPLNTLTFANGQLMNKLYDNNYRVIQISVVTTATLDTALVLDYIPDAVGNFSQITQSIGTPAVSQTQTYGYDKLYRLTDVKDQNDVLIERYTYDKTGNRLSLQPGTQAVKNYVYNNTPAAPVLPTDPTYGNFSHRLNSVAGNARSYDQNGNTITGIPSTSGETFDARNRLTNVANGATNLVSSKYNGKGERVLKTSTSNAGGTRLVFDEAGQLIAQKGSGTAGTEDSYEVVWLDNMPIAVLTNKAGVIGFENAILSDHLMSPRALTGGVTSTQPGTTVWRWDLVQGNTSTGNSNAFGAALANQDPDANSVATVFNLRFPGQQFDNATALNYNYFRDYESATGRYVESDPVGLDYGVDTYSYALENPVRFADPLGLFCVTTEDCACIKDVVNCPKGIPPRAPLPIPLPQPLGNPNPDSDAEKKRCETCWTKYGSTYDLCWDIAIYYPYDSPGDVMRNFPSGKMGNEKNATSANCAEGNGKHYNVYGAKRAYQGSAVFSCKCCVNRDSGPELRTKWGTTGDR